MFLDPGLCRLSLNEERLFLQTSDFFYKKIRKKKVRFNTQLKHLLNHNADVMTQHLQQHLINLRHIRLTAQRIFKLLFIVSNVVSALRRVWLLQELLVSTFKVGYIWLH
jgi:hypothetical protein